MMNGVLMVDQYDHVIIIIIQHGCITLIKINIFLHKRERK